MCGRLPGEPRAGPRFVLGHVLHDVEPVRNKRRRLFGVIDFGNQRAVLVLVDGNEESIPLNHVPPLAEHSGRQRGEEGPLVAI